MEFKSLNEDTSNGVEKKKETLEELLKKCKDENKHEEIDFGIVGRESI